MFRSLALSTAALLGSTVLVAPVMLVMAPAPAFAQDVDPTGSTAVAERLARMAQLSLSGRTVSDDHFRQATALLRAACRMSPNEPRFSRLLTDAALQLHDTDTAIAALEMYTKAKPSDQWAKLQLIDLYVAQMQTSERRLEYLTGQLVENQALPSELRSAAAVRAARLHLDRDQHQRAMEMIDRAIELEPLNPEACAMHYERLGPSDPPHVRVSALLAMLRANPAQPGVLADLGHELADAGLHDLSQQWYARAFDLYPRLGQPADPEEFLNAAAGALVLGQAKTAESRATALLSVDPLNFDAHLIRYFAMRRLGTEDQSAGALADMTSALVLRAKAIHAVLGGEEMPTDPGDPRAELFERIPDPSEEIRRLRDAGNPDWIERYAQTLSNLAWTQIDFAKNQANGQRLLEALRDLLPPESVVITRFEGLLLLASGRTDEARVKLSAIADRDPIARLGLIRLDMTADRDAAGQQAIDLLSENNSGILGAVLAASLEELDVRGNPSASAEEIRSVLARFPMQFLDILDKPSEFYAVTAEAPRVSHEFGQPMLITVTIRNNSKFDIAMGPSGALRPDLWFDCSIRGVVNQSVPGVAFDRIGGKLVLRRNDIITHVTRADQGQLWQLIQANPSAAFPLFFSVFTNPVPAQTMAAPGPGGYRVQVRKPVERVATPIFAANEQQKVFNQLALGNAGDKVRLQEMFAYYSNFLSNQQTQDFSEMAEQLRQAVAQGMSDPDPNVSAWSGYVTTLMETEPRKSALAKRLTDGSNWLARLLIATATDALTPEAKMAILTKLSEDSDPLVQAYAKATKAIAETLPTDDDEDGDGVGSIGP